MNNSSVKPFDYDSHPRVCCDYCGHQIPMSIQQMRDGFRPHSVCESCAIDVRQQLDDLDDAYCI